MLRSKLKTRNMKLNDSFFSLVNKGWSRAPNLKVRFSVNSPPEDRPTLNQPSPTFRAPIRPQNIDETVFPYQYFLSDRLRLQRESLTYLLDNFANRQNSKFLMYSLNYFIAHNFYLFEPSFVQNVQIHKKNSKKLTY